MKTNNIKLSAVFSLIFGVVGILSVLFMIIYGLGVVINLTEVFNLGINEYSNITSQDFLAELKTAIILDSIKEGIFAIAVIVLAILMLCKAKNNNAHAVKNISIFLIILEIIAVAFTLFNKMQLSFTDLSYFVDELKIFYQIYLIFAYAVVGFAILAFIFNLVGVSAVNKHLAEVNNKLLSGLMSPNDSGNQNVNNVLQSQKQFSNEQFTIANNQVNVEKYKENNDMAVLLGLETASKNSVQQSSQQVQSQSQTQDRLQILKDKIGAQRLEHAKIKAKEYKQKLDNGEFSLAEYDALMNLLKNDLLNN